MSDALVLDGLEKGYNRGKPSEVLVLRLESVVTQVAQVFGTTFDLHGLGWDESLLLLLISAMIGWIAAWLATVQHLRRFTPQ